MQHQPCSQQQLPQQAQQPPQLSFEHPQYVLQATEALTTVVETAPSNLAAKQNCSICKAVLMHFIQYSHVLLQTRSFCQCAVWWWNTVYVHVDLQHCCLCMVLLYVIHCVCTVSPPVLQVTCQYHTFSMMLHNACFMCASCHFTGLTGSAASTHTKYMTRCQRVMQVTAKPESL